ncbi:MAG: hypothetical protein HC779_03430 [Phyllobacteriaceae bacterium]|nr:hypothetical protein [Phyllobacteriaceae bacterium]
MAREIAIAVDLTNSMNFGMSWAHVSDALGELLNSLKAQGPSARFRVSLVPFNDRVNLGPTSLDWLDDDVLAKVSCPDGEVARLKKNSGDDDDYDDYDDDDDDDDDDGDKIKVKMHARRRCRQWLARSTNLPSFDGMAGLP